MKKMKRGKRQARAIGDVRKRGADGKMAMPQSSYNKATGAGAGGRNYSQAKKSAQ